MKIAVVRWVDSGAHLDFDKGWKPLVEYVGRADLGRMEAESVGFVMHMDDDVILLGQTHDVSDENRWIGAQVIAMQNVISMTTTELSAPVPGSLP